MSPTIPEFKPVTSIDVTAISDNEHIIFALSEIELSACEVAVIVTVPAAITVTKPVELTVAIDVLELDHITTLLVALEGRTEAIS